MQQPPADDRPGGRAGSAGPDRPIFVAACPRSGTTLVQLMLSAHPRIAIPPETRFLLAAYYDRARFGDLRDPARRAELVEWISHQPQSHDLRLDLSLLRARAEEVPGTLGSVIGAVFREYAASYGKPRWGDKRPLYLNHLPTLLRLFPDAQIVHIVRDGRDCVASLKRMPWWHSDSMSATGRWLQSMKMARRARATLRADQYHELRYEDLVADPRTQLEQLCTFLGESFDQAMLEPARLAAEAVPSRKTWHRRTHDAVTPAAADQWAEALEPWEAGVIERLGRGDLRRYGYPIAPDGPAPPLPKVAAAATDFAKREVVRRRQRLGDRARAATERRPVAALLTAGQVAVAKANGDWTRARAGSTQQPAGAAGPAR